MSSGRGPGRPRSVRAQRAVLEAAFALLTDRGLTGTSVDEVARRAGVSKATIYRHWSSKEALCVDAVGRLSAEMGCGESGDPRADVLAVIRDLVGTAQGSPAGQVLPRLVGEAADNPRMAAAWRSCVVTPRRQRLARLLRQAADDGQLRDDLDLEVAVDLLVAPVFYRRLISGAPMSAAGWPEQLVDAVWRAFAPGDGHRGDGR